MGCFQFLAIMNNAVVNIDVRGIFLTYVFIFLGYIPKSGMFGSYSNSNFLRKCKTFSKQLYHFTFLPAVYEGSSFSTSSPTLVISLFDYSIASGYEVVSHYDLICIGIIYFYAVALSCFFDYTNCL